MAGPRAHRNPRRNTPPAGEDELAGAAPTEGSGTPTLTPVVSRAPNPALTTAPAVAPSLDNKLFKQFMKAYLEAQVPGQTEIDPEPCKQPLKARFPDLYYGNSHMDCYRFCQQCEDHFETAGAKGPNRIPFAASFLRGSVTQRWLQHKRRRDGAVPMTWVEFKDFLWKNLGDSRAFVDSIWKKVKRNSQYQDKSVQDWAAHLEYLQSILIEFDSECAPEEGTMIRYFREGLRPSVRVEMEQRGRELDSFEELVKKAVDAKAKAALRPRSYARETDQHCLQSSRPFAAKTNTQCQPMKDPRVEKPKSRPQELKAPAPQRSTDNAEISEQARKEKNKKEKRKRRNQEREP